jgi:hypothetical protein
MKLIHRPGLKDPNLVPGRRQKIGDVRKGPLTFGNRYWRAETELLRTEKGANSWSRQERYQE